MQSTLAKSIEIKYCQPAQSSEKMTFEGIVLLHAVACCPGQVEDAVDCVRCLAKPVKAGRDVLKYTVESLTFHALHGTSFLSDLFWWHARIPEKAVRHK